MLFNITQKRCTKCGVEKPISQFPKQKDKRDGRSSWCSSCHQANSKKIRSNNLEKYQARAREKYRENPQKYQEQTKKSYEIHKDKRLEYSKKYSSEHKEDAISRVRKWRAENPDKYKEQNKRLREKRHDELKVWKRLWARDNKEKVNKRNSDFRKRHPDTTAVHCRNRRARVKGSKGKLTAKEWTDLKIKYNYTCLCCLRKEPEIKVEIDHVVPLSLGGANSIENIQPLCHSCNSSKGAKIIDYRPAYEKRWL